MIFLTDPTYSARLPNRPFRIDESPVNHPVDAKTRDLVHRFYQTGEDFLAEIDNGTLPQVAFYEPNGKHKWLNNRAENSHHPTRER